MLPSRFAPSGQSSALRKPRLEGKQSLLPRPRRPGSTDRLSNENRRPSTAGHRSSSAEPRSTFGGGRLSREASATKLPPNSRSRSQTTDRYGQTSMTPLRNSAYSRPTTTPQRTPSEDRSNRSWQTSLDRALAFLTVKDQRQISNVAWQRSQCSRVQELLAARGGGTAALIRPLTIARFVEIVRALLNSISQDAKLNNDNYVTKLPHLSKRFLYPGVVSKSWLKTVNTLHAFPQALALIAYFLDLVMLIEEPVSYDWMYARKDELACLKREFVYKCWIRFQEPGHQFEDLNLEYLQNVKALLGNHDERIAELQHIIQNYEACLEDETERAARAHEATRVARRDALRSQIRSERARRRDASANIQTQTGIKKDQIAQKQALTMDIERLTAEIQQLKSEIEQQTLSVAERTKLQDEIYYAIRVQESKKELAEQIEKMLQSKELELALWQKKSLDSCVQYKQTLIHLGTQYPSLTELAIDEKELMSSACGTLVAAALGSLRALAGDLAAKRASHARNKTAVARQRAAKAEEVRNLITTISTSIQQEQHSVDIEVATESTEAADFARDQATANAKLDVIKANLKEYSKVSTEAKQRKEHQASWLAKVSAMQDYITEQRLETKRLLESAKAKRAQLLMQTVEQWSLKLEA